nr:RNA-directed DNA polymerase, eukaryota [Tanacetum cinerariifolium]
MYALYNSETLSCDSKAPVKAAQMKVTRVGSSPSQEVGYVELPYSLEMFTGRTLLFTREDGGQNKIHLIWVPIIAVTLLSCSVGGSPDSRESKSLPAYVNKWDATTTSGLAIYHPILRFPSIIFASIIFLIIFASISTRISEGVGLARSERRSYAHLLMHREGTCPRIVPIPFLFFNTLSRRWIGNPIDVKDEFFNHFSMRFRNPDPKEAYIKMDFPNVLSQEDRQFIEREVSIDEIKKAVCDCGTDKAPGPDGFTFGFYRRY